MMEALTPLPSVVPLEAVHPRREGRRSPEGLGAVSAGKGGGTLRQRAHSEGWEERTVGPWKGHVTGPSRHKLGSRHKTNPVRGIQQALILSRPHTWQPGPLGPCHSVLGLAGCRGASWTCAQLTSNAGPAVTSQNVSRPCRSKSHQGRTLVSTDRATSSDNDHV